MDNERKNVPLVGRKENLKENNRESIEESTFFINKRIREENRRLKIQKEISRRIIAASVAVGIVSSLIGGSGVIINNNRVDSEDETLSQPVYDDDFDETRPFAPEYLVFDEIVQSIDGGEYRVVVNKYGECSFVSKDYQTPFPILDGQVCYDVATRLGFDFDSMTVGRSK